MINQGVDLTNLIKTLTKFVQLSNIEFDNVHLEVLS